MLCLIIVFMVVIGFIQETRLLCLCSWVFGDWVTLRGGCWSFEISLGSEQRRSSKGAFFEVIFLGATSLSLLYTVL